MEGLSDLVGKNMKKNKFLEIIKLGNKSRLKGEFERALNYYQKALKYVQNKEDEATAYNSMGITYRGMKKLELSIKSYQKSLNIMTDLKDLTGVAGAYTNLANIYIEKGELNEALSKMNFARMIFTAISSRIDLSNTNKTILTNTNRVGLANSNLGLANIYLKLKRLGLAILSAQDALRIVENECSPYYHAKAYLVLSNAYLLIKMYKQAKEATTHALELGRLAKINEIMEEAKRLLSLINEVEKEIDSSR